MAKLLAAICVASLLIWVGARGYNGIYFDIECGDFQKRAADSNSIELAESNLTKVVAYAEKHGMTSGSTMVIFDYPAYDVGFWYNNARASLDELRKVKANPNATPLEQSNVLMKLEKTMIDHGSSGTSINVPAGISIFPHNKLFFWWCAASILGTLLFGLLAAAEVVGQRQRQRA